MLSLFFSRLCRTTKYRNINKKTIFGRHRLRKIVFFLKLFYTFKCLVLIFVFLQIGLNFLITFFFFFIESIIRLFILRRCHMYFARIKIIENFSSFYCEKIEWPRRTVPDGFTSSVYKVRRANELPFIIFYNLTVSTRGDLFFQSQFEPFSASTVE